MEWYNKLLAVTFRELTETNPDAVGDACRMTVMSVSNYYKLSNKGRITVLRQGKGKDNPALVEYESLPVRFKERFLTIWGDPYENIKESMLRNELVTDRDARRFFAEYLLPDGEHIPEDFQEEYTRNASVLNLLIETLNHRRALRRAMQNGQEGVWETIYGTVDKLRENPGHTLPKSRARLRDKINEYKKRGYVCLISGKLGNTNTVKITEEGGTFLVMQKRRRVPVMADEQIMEEYNRVAPNYGWKKLTSTSSVTKYLNAPENVQRWYDAVYGELKAYQKFGYKFKTVLPECRDALWYGDGTKINLYYKAYENGKSVMKTIQVYEVMDAYSEVLLGYHISESENFEAQYNAYRMAVETSGVRPFEIVVDNQGGHKKLGNSGFMRRICRLQRNTMPYRGSGKTIESVFGRFQRQVLRQDWRFTGQNITAKTDESRPNMEFVMTNKESLYTLAELKEAYAEARKKWNAMPHPATGIPRMEMYAASENPKAEPVDRLDMIELFWLMTRKPATFTASGLTVTIGGREYTYDVYTRDGLPDLLFRKRNIGKKFYTQYDPDDLTQVRLYEMTASGLRYVADAMPYVKVMRAMQDATYDSSSFIRRVMNLEEQLRIDTFLDNIALEHEHGVAPEQYGLNRPEPKAISKRASERIAGTEIPENARSGKRRFEPAEIGEYDKEVSNMTYDEISMLDKL